MSLRSKRIHAVDINLDDAPQVIYAYFVLHNFCELNNDSVNDEAVRSAVAYDRQFQPQSSPERAPSNETEGKKVRRILATYFDP